MISVVSVWTRINMQICVWYWQIYPVVKFKHGTGGYSDVEHALRASVLQCSCFQHCVWFVMQYCQHTKHPTSSDIVTVTAARRSEHMIHILRDLYCLPVRHRITFKTAVLVYSVCTAWLCSTFRRTASRRQQSPAGVFDPLTPVDWLFHAPEQTMATNFTVQGPPVWNSLPSELCTLDIMLSMFRNRLYNSVQLVTVTGTQHTCSFSAILCYINAL